MRFKFAFALAACAGLVAGCSSDSGNTASPSSSPSPPSPASSSDTVAGSPSSTAAPAPACGHEVLDSLPLRRKLAQLLDVGVTGTSDALQVVQNEQVGGIFVGSWTEDSMLANREVQQVSAASELPLTVSIDEEGGRVSRVEDLLGADPSARVTAQTMTEEQTYQMALERGRGLKDLGITVNFAPDVDVSSQPDDSVIGDRSYSDDPEVVTRYADAYARGMRDAGVTPVFKHFPGHGSGSGDSHTGAVTTPPLDQLQAKDLIPYRTLLPTGGAVMLGHLDVPGLTQPGIPASISPEAVELLRSGGYGGPPYPGPIYTDDLSGMKAITDRYDIPQAVETALAAGVDVALWLTAEDVPRVLDHLESAVASGSLPQERVDEAVVAVARAKGIVTC